MEDQQLVPMLEEYRSLRLESIEIQKNHQSILKFAITTIVLVIVAGFNFWKEVSVVSLLFLLCIPFLSYFFLFIWVAEVQRLMRVGFFISLIEKRISNLFPGVDNIISWENWLRSDEEGKRAHQHILLHLGMIGILLSCSIISIIIGNIRIWEIVDIRYLVIYNTVEFLILFIVCISVFLIGKSFKSY